MTTPAKTGPATAVVKLTPEEEAARRRRRRSIALGLVLGGLVLIFYILTIVKLGPAVFQRDL